jgi:hypothetical protein
MFEYYLGEVPITLTLTGKKKKKKKYYSLSFGNILLSGPYDKPFL